MPVRLCLQELAEAELSVDDDGEQEDDDEAAAPGGDHYNMSPSAIVSLLLLNLAPAQESAPSTPNV